MKLLALLLFLVFIIFWKHLSISPTHERSIDCVDDLNKKIQTYKQFFKVLNGRDITPEEWEAETKSLNIYDTLKELNIIA